MKDHRDAALAGSEGIKKLPELLAPAGGMDALHAALEAGADAIYLGLATLNARRGAENFTPDSLREAVKLANTRGVRVYLTLNILLNAREVGEAARALELARSCGVDAVLVADPAVLLFREHYPELAFHFSTQAAVTTSAGVLAAAALGVRRVVLAREMSLAEIVVAADAGTAANPPVETEVFIQGALCLCVSGRCLLSSWGGGRSGNRGACTSPCRVRWSVDGFDEGTPLSMHDLCALEQLPDLMEAGVRCLKIEGRLKNPDWVQQAVSTYRQALQEIQKTGREAVAGSGEAARGLGIYAGRLLSAGYLTGARENMTGESGRACSMEDLPASAAKRPDATEQAAVRMIELHINTSGAKIHCTIIAGAVRHEWEITKTKIHNPARALTLQQAADWLETQVWIGAALAQIVCDDPEFLVPKKAANRFADEISALLHRLNKPAGQRKHLPVELSPEVRALTNPPVRCMENERILGHKPNLVRLQYAQTAEFLKAHSPEAVVVGDCVEDFLQAQVERKPGGCASGANDTDNTAEESVAEMVDPFGLEALREVTTTSRLVVMLPAVFFEVAVPVVFALCKECCRLGLSVEVNGWDGWQLARAAGVQELWGGPGMAVLNPQAALFLRGCGLANVHYSLEIGERQAEELSAHLPLPGTLCVYGRPVLVYTRAGLPEELRAGAILEDARKIRLRVERGAGLTRLRAVEPFNIAHRRNERVQARWLSADLCGSADAVAEWARLRLPAKAPFAFNFERGLY